MDAVVGLEGTTTEVAVGVAASLPDGAPRPTVSDVAAWRQARVQASARYPRACLLLQSWDRTVALAAIRKLGTRDGGDILPSHARFPQVVLLALVCFCCPGMFNALASMGGGLSDQSVVANSTAALYAVFVASSLAAPVACRQLGPRLALFGGTLGYAVFVVAIVAYQQGRVGEWVVVACGAINGLSAGLLWTAQVRGPHYPSPPSHLTACLVIRSG